MKCSPGPLFRIGIRAEIGYRKASTASSLLLRLTFGFLLYSPTPMVLHNRNENGSANFQPKSDETACDGVLPAFCELANRPSKLLCKVIQDMSTSKAFGDRILFPAAGPAICIIAFQCFLHTSKSPCSSIRWNFARVSVCPNGVHVGCMAFGFA
jgi:hypothetical protein